MGVNALLELGADTNAVDNYYGSGPLHRAIKYGTIETVKALINAKADINLTNRRGFTPLLQACRDKLYKFVIVLLHAGADVTVKTNDGRGVVDIIFEAEASDEQIAIRELL